MGRPRIGRQVRLLVKSQLLVKSHDVVSLSAIWPNFAAPLVSFALDLASGIGAIPITGRFDTSTY